MNDDYAIESLVACLGDDAASLRAKNPECEIAANMERAARRLEDAAKREDLLVSAHAIAAREGRETNWPVFEDRCKALGVGSVTAKVFKTPQFESALSGSMPNAPVAEAQSGADADLWGVYTDDEPDPLDRWHVCLTRDEANMLIDHLVTSGKRGRGPHVHLRPLYFAAPLRDGGFDMLAHLRRQREWSERTFGPGDRAKGVVDHIRKELVEIEAEPGDLGEWIDVAILALDGAWRAGWTPEAIVAKLIHKQARNESRTWPDWRTMPTDKAIEHDRTAEAPLQSTHGRRIPSWPSDHEVWSTDNETFRYDSLGELIDGNDRELEVGSVVWVGTASVPAPRTLVDADFVLDGMRDRSDDLGGEYAEDYPEVSAEATAELDDLLTDWVRRHAPPNFYTVDSVREHVITAEDLEREPAAEVPET